MRGRSSVAAAWVENGQGRRRLRGLALAAHRVSVTFFARATCSTSALLAAPSCAAAPLARASSKHASPKLTLLPIA